MDYAQELLRLIQALHAHHVAYVLIGGGALNVHGLVRATQDIDLFIAPTTENVEHLKAALRSIWNDPHLDEIAADDLCGEYPAVRYGPPEGTIFLDILTRLGTRLSYTDLEHEEIEIGGTPIRVATPRSLYRMRSATRCARSIARMPPRSERSSSSTTTRGAMPVERYRDVVQMPPPPRPKQEDLLAVIAAVWQRAHLRLKPVVPRGVSKFPTIEAAQAQRRERNTLRIRALRAKPHGT